MGKYDDKINNGVIVGFDGAELTNELYHFLVNLGAILDYSGQLGDMVYKIFHFQITSLQKVYFTKKKFN